MVNLSAKFTDSKVVHMGNTELPTLKVFNDGLFIVAVPYSRQTLCLNMTPLVEQGRNTIIAIRHARDKGARMSSEIYAPRGENRPPFHGLRMANGAPARTKERQKFVRLFFVTIFPPRSSAVGVVCHLWRDIAAGVAYKEYRAMSKPSFNVT